MKKLDINWPDLLLAFDNNSYDLTYYLDTETGETNFVTEESLHSLEFVFNQVQEDELSRDFDFTAILAQSDLQDWQKQEILEAYQIKSDKKSRFLEVPRRNSHDAYNLMRDFISQVENVEAAGRLLEAIRLQKPFRRFKDVLYDYPAEREKWFTFQEEQHKEEIIDWLKEKGIEPQKIS